ncbi:MAG: hypothetical protein LBQ66_14750 [Planctomycetaceae bacterium]|nr:hypothetical protein [Planctomycetaceae bacterium]
MSVFARLSCLTARQILRRNYISMSNNVKGGARIGADVSKLRFGRDQFGKIRLKC